MSTNSTLRLSLLIEAVDKATAVVKRIGAAVDKLGSPAARARAALDKTLSNGGLERVRMSVERIRTTLHTVATASKWAFGGILAGATTASLATIGSARRMDDLVDSSRLLKVPVERMQELGFAAEQSGSSFDDMVSSLRFLHLNAGKALGGDKELLQWFARVGISATDLRKKRVDELLMQISDKIAAVGDAGGNASKKIDVVQALMGRSGWRNVQLLEAGSKGFAQLAEQARKAGAIVPASAAERLAEFNDKLVQFSGTMSTRVALLGVMAVPVLTKLIDRFTALAIANGDKWGAAIEKAVDKLPGFIDGVIALASWLDDLLSLLLQGVDAIGGWQTVLLAIEGFIAGRLIYTLVQLGTVLRVVALAFLATPFGWVAAGIAGLVAGAALLVKYWEPLQRLFDTIWESLKGIFSFGDSALPSSAGSLSSLRGPGDALASPIGQAGGRGPFRPDVKVGGHMVIEFNEATGKHTVKSLAKTPGSPLDLEVDTGLVMFAR